MPASGPVSFCVIMSQLPESNWPAACWLARSAMLRWLKLGLESVRGTASLAVGPAEAASGVKSSK
jgi:hypothetical protein